MTLTCARLPCSITRTRSSALAVTALRTPSNCMPRPVGNHIRFRRGYYGPPLRRPHYYGPPLRRPHRVATARPYSRRSVNDRRYVGCTLAASLVSCGRVALKSISLSWCRARSARSLSALWARYRALHAISCKAISRRRLMLSSKGLKVRYRDSATASPAPLVGAHAT